MSKNRQLFEQFWEFNHINIIQYLTFQLNNDDMTITRFLQLTGFQTALTTNELRV